MSKKILTVDFDDTLATTRSTAWEGSALIPIQRVIDFVKQKHKQGFEVHIVTFRSFRNKPEVEKFVQFNDLPIKHIHCTDGASKVTVLKQLNSCLHIDDDIQTLVAAEMAGISTLLVDWNQEEINTAALLFQKI